MSERYRMLTHSLRACSYTILSKLTGEQWKKRSNLNCSRLVSSHMYAYFFHVQKEYLCDICPSVEAVFSAYIKVRQYSAGELGTHIWVFPPWRYIYFPPFIFHVYRYVPFYIYTLKLIFTPTGKQIIKPLQRLRLMSHVPFTLIRLILVPFQHIFFGDTSA